MDYTNAVFSKQEDNKNTPLLCQRYTATKEHTMKNFHYHMGYEIYWLTSGSVAAGIGDKVYNIKKGNMVIIPPYVPHRNEYFKHDSNFRTVINVSTEYLSDFMLEILNRFKKNPVLFFSPQDQDVITSIMKKLDKELSAEKNYTSYLRKAYMTELLVYIDRYNIPMNSDAAETTVQNMIKYINNNYQNNISVDGLADIFHISKSSVLRKFKRYTGSNINEYINFIRILNAEKLLLENHLSITETAFLCGFNDSNYFSTVFKKFKGVPPLKYVKKHKIDIINTE